MKNKFGVMNYKIILIMIFFLSVLAPINVKAIQIIRSNDTQEDKQAKCDKYYTCIEKVIKAAKEDNITLTSSNLQTECMDDLVSVGGKDYDFCDNKRLLKGKNLKELLEESAVYNSNDSYQQNKQKCEDAKKVAIEDACSSCTRCLDRNQGQAKSCQNECTIGKPTPCTSGKDDAQTKISVLHPSYCEYKYDPAKWDDEDESLYKPLTGGDYVCGGMLSEGLRDELIKIYKTITLIMVVAVIILGMLDFFKAISAGDADTMKKATKKFSNRLIIVILIAILPVILQFILTLFGNESMKNCLKFFK